MLFALLHFILENTFFWFNPAVYRYLWNRTHIISIYRNMRLWYVHVVRGLVQSIWSKYSWFGMSNFPYLVSSFPILPYSCISWIFVYINYFCKRCTLINVKFVGIWYLRIYYKEDEYNINIWDLEDIWNICNIALYCTV